MRFFDIFSRNGRDAIRAEVDYADCSRFRRDKLRGFRKNAVNDILFKYPDAIPLLNYLDTRFMVLLKSQGRLLVGKFADAYFPRLDYLTESSGFATRRDAVARFRNQLNTCRGNISAEMMADFKNGSRCLSEAAGKSFMEKGYAITGSAELKYLVGGALFFDDKQIAKATIWDPKPKGFFTGQILEIVIANSDRRPGIHSLNFLTVDCNPVGEGQKMGYEILFDRSIDQFQPENSNDFTVSIINFRDFIYSLEDFFKADCAGCDEDKMEYTSTDSADCLDSSKRDEDRSIESRYLL